MVASEMVASKMVASEAVAMDAPGAPVPKRSVREVHSPKAMASKSHATTEVPEPAAPKTPTAEVSTEPRLRGVGPQAKRAEAEEDQETFGIAVQHAFSSTSSWRFPGRRAVAGACFGILASRNGFCGIRPKSRLPLFAENGRGAPYAGIGTNPSFRTEITGGI